MNKSLQAEFLGELIGTFILVFLGCGSVAVTVLFNAHHGLLQVALIWGIAVTLAIYASRHLSGAHLNPAVSLAMVIAKRMKANKLPLYVCAQFFGAFAAAFLLYFMFSTSFSYFEAQHSITRGSAESIQTAMIFGEFYPNPAFQIPLPISMLAACLTEGIATFALLFFIFCFTDSNNIGKPASDTAPLFIGLTVTVLVSIIAPLTQAGLNPARDLAPRLVAYLMGWGKAAFPDQTGGFIVVYVIGPLLGAALSALFFQEIYQPLLIHQRKQSQTPTE